MAEPINGRNPARKLPLPQWSAIAVRPPGVYALAGEEVICQRGHPVGRFAKDVHYGEAPAEDAFIFTDGTRPKEGEPLPRCKVCGALAFNAWREGEHIKVAAHFRDGWRS